MPKSASQPLLSWIAVRHWLPNVEKTKVVAVVVARPTHAAVLRGRSSLLAQGSANLDVDTPRLNSAPGHREAARAPAGPEKQAADARSSDCDDA